MPESGLPWEDGLPLQLDETARSANPEVPAFLARPEGAAVYHGFPVLPETAVDRFTYGAITELGHNRGDGFVVAPDGSRAGLAWSVHTGTQKPQITQIYPLESSRWGVWDVTFAQP